MRARFYRKRVRLHNEDEIDDPWSTWDWAAAMIGDESADGGPPDGRDDPAPTGTD